MEVNKKRIKNKKGFTLIELLAVIVILGLLMAIAIPSVTKYITQSRKKTVVTTIGNYITAMVNEVNDLTYSFTGSNTVYAVPVECIALERGGTNPFGEWHQANKDYWAYVLIQYDEENSSYTYGYTFKDSSGYGIYPTIQSKLNTQGKQIQTKLDLSKPETGKVTTITPVDNWEGFEVDASTDLVVLEATKEGEVGNGKTTCTLCQKGKNYEQIQQDKINGGNNDQNGEEEVIDEREAYAIYSENDKTLTFVRSENEIKAGDVYDGINVTNVYTGFENFVSNGNGMPWSSIDSDVEKVIFRDVIKPGSTYYWFAGFRNCSYFDVTNLDTSNVTNMSYMFGDTWNDTGNEESTFTIVGMDKWDTSKVTDMSWMFFNAGSDATTFDIGDLSKWNTSNVTDMSRMFSGAAGSFATTFDIGNLSNWDTSKVTDMSYMFYYAGHMAETFNIGDLSNWDTSNVTDMSWMFSSAGYYAKFKLDLSKWKVDKVTSYDDFNSSVEDKVTPPNWIN